MPADAAASELAWNDESIVNDKIRNVVKFGGEQLVEETYRDSKGHEYVFFLELNKAQINDLHNNGLRVDYEMINRAIARRHKLLPPFALGQDVIAIKSAYTFLFPDGVPFAGTGKLQIVDNNPNIDDKKVVTEMSAAALATDSPSSFWNLGLVEPPPEFRLFGNNDGGEYIIQADAAITGGGAGAKIVVKLVCEANRWVIPPGI